MKCPVFICYIWQDSSWYPEEIKELVDTNKEIEVVC
jgi:hypothetical protein